MEMEQMMECLLAKMEARIEPNSKKYEILRDTLISWMDAHHARTEANQEELRATVEASHERIEALRDVSQEIMELYAEIMEVNPEEMKSWQEETMTCQEVMEACLEKAKEPTSVEVKSVVVHEDVHKEDAAVKPIGALEEAAQGLAFSCRAPRETEGMYPGQWWVLEEVGCRQQRDISPCKCGTAQRRWS
jgi:hypothetical protein